MGWLETALLPALVYDRITPHMVKKTDTTPLEAPTKARTRAKAAPKAKREGSALEERLNAQMVDAGLSPEREYRFCPDRKWRADFAFPSDWIIIEVEGGLYGKPVICDKCHLPVMRNLGGGRRMPVREAGRHNTGAGFEKDVEKYNWAEMHGWMILRFSGTMIKSGKAIEIVLEAINIVRSRNDTAH